MKQPNKSLTFEKAMSRLEEIVEEMDQDSLDLDKSLSQFEEGMMLAKICETKLSEASGRIEKIMKSFSGTHTIEALTKDELDPEN